MKLNAWDRLMLILFLAGGLFFLGSAQGQDLEEVVPIIQSAQYQKLLQKIKPEQFKVPQEFKQYMMREQKLNDHFRKKGIKTEVGAKYLPSAAEVFELPYVEVPVSDLHVVDLQNLPKDVGSQFYVRKRGRKYIRYFIHPESLELYRPLIKKYPIQGFFLATPTSSTRTLLAWDPANAKAEPFFVKVSLDKVQFGWGRAVPDHEVRRSVIASKQIDTLPVKERDENKLEIMPEVLGAYVDKKWGMKAWIHDSQGGYNPQHGMVVRVAGDLFKKGNGDKIYPAFSLFSEQEVEKDGAKTMRPPLIIEWWQKSGRPWKEFIKESFLDPVIEGTSYMTMVQGYLPEMHGQNFMVQVDPQTHKVEKVIHRDVGGIRHVDLELRMVNGLPIEELKSVNPSKDFRFADAVAAQKDVYYNWLYPYLFKESKGFAPVLQKYIPDYKEEEMRDLMEEIIFKYAKKHLGTEHVNQLNKSLKKYVQTLAWPIRPEQELSMRQKKVLQQFVEGQEKRGQVVELKNFKYHPSFRAGDFLKTEYGVFFRRSHGEGEVNPILALYAEGQNSSEWEDMGQGCTKKEDLAFANVIKLAQRIPSFSISKVHRKRRELLPVAEETRKLLVQINETTKEINHLTSEISNLLEENRQLMENEVSSDVVVNLGNKRKIKENKKRIMELKERRESLRKHKDELKKGQESKEQLKRELEVELEAA